MRAGDRAAFQGDFDYVDQTPPLFLATIASLLIALLPCSAAAQLFDHLECYKVKDERTFQYAYADLQALQTRFGLENCKIKGRATNFCVPADEEVTEIVGGQIQPLAGDEQTFDRLCDIDGNIAVDVASNPVSLNYNPLRSPRACLMQDLPARHRRSCRHRHGRRQFRGTRRRPLVAWPRAEGPRRARS